MAKYVVGNSTLLDNNFFESKLETSTIFEYAVITSSSRWSNGVHHERYACKDPFRLWRLRPETSVEHVRWASLPGFVNWAPGRAQPGERAPY